MFDILGRLVLQLHGQIDNPDTLLHVGSSDISDPAWNRGRKEEDLQIFATLSSACSEDLINLLFEALLEHLISFVKNDGL